jgi:prepilin-type N-terminal cleavage/methylation domain-containing protein
MINKKAFTLIEMLVAITVIGILASLVINRVELSRVKARNSQAKSDISQAGRAIELYKNDDDSEGRAIAANTPVTASSGPIVGSLNSCGTAAIPKSCNVVALSRDSSSGSLEDIFTGRVKVSTTAPINTYGLDIKKVPGAGYSYYYMTLDTEEVPANSKSQNTEYFFIADLGEAGAKMDGNRYYYVTKGIADSLPGEDEAAVGAFTLP